MSRPVDEWIGKTDATKIPPRVRERIFLRAFTEKDRARILAALEDKTIPEPNTGCLLWLGASKAKGYGHLFAAGSYIGAHRASYIVNIGPIPDGMVVMHRCDTPACVNHLHLTVGTYRDNIHDCISKNRARRGGFSSGELHPHAKLTADQVEAIRAAPRHYGYRILLSKRFQVSPQTISNIVVGIRWR